MLKAQNSKKNRTFGYDKYEMQVWNLVSSALSLPYNGKYIQD